MSNDAGGEALHGADQQITKNPRLPESPSGLKKKDSEENKYKFVMPRMLGLWAHLEFQRLMLGEQEKVFLPEFRKFLGQNLSTAIDLQFRNEAVAAKEKIVTELGPEIYETVTWVKEPMFMTSHETEIVYSVLKKDESVIASLSAEFGSPLDFVRRCLIDPNINFDLKYKDRDGNEVIKNLTAKEMFDRGRQILQEKETYKHFIPIFEKTENFAELTKDMALQDKVSMLFVSALSMGNFDFRGTKLESDEAWNRVIMRGGTRADLIGFRPLDPNDSEAAALVRRSSEFMSGMMENYAVRTTGQLEDFQRLIHMISGEPPRVGTVFVEMKNTFSTNPDLEKVKMELHEGAIGDCGHTLLVMYEAAARGMNLPGIGTEADLHWKQALRLMESPKQSDLSGGGAETDDEELRRTWLEAELRADHFQSIYWLARKFMQPKNNRFLLVEAVCPWIDEEDRYGYFGGLVGTYQIESSQPQVALDKLAVKEVLTSMSHTADRWRRQAMEQELQINKIV